MRSHQGFLKSPEEWTTRTAFLFQDQTESHGMTESENALRLHNKFRDETTGTLISFISECCVQKSFRTTSSVAAELSSQP